MSKITDRINRVENVKMAIFNELKAIFPEIKMNIFSFNEKKGSRDSEYLNVIFSTKIAPQEQMEEILTKYSSGSFEDKTKGTLTVYHVTPMGLSVCPWEVAA